MNSGPVRNGGRDAEARYSIFHFLSHCKAKEPHSAQPGSQFLIPIRDFFPSLPKNFYPLSEEKKTPGEKSPLLHRIGGGGGFPFWNGEKFCANMAHIRFHIRESTNVRGKYHYYHYTRLEFWIPRPHLALAYIPVLCSRRWNGNCCIMLFCHHTHPPTTTCSIVIHCRGRSHLLQSEGKNKNRIWCECLEKLVTLSEAAPKRKKK